MAYAELNQPFPDLTVNPEGFPHDPHTLGDASFDTSSTDNFGDLIDPTVPPQDYTSLIPDPIYSVDPTFEGNLPLAPSSPSLTSLYPESIGTEFLSQGDGSYMNIQTGQIVPQSVAEGVTAATIGAGTANVDTASAQNNLTIVDPVTGHPSAIPTNNLSVAAQGLQAAGHLIDATGKLTAQGVALLHSGNLYKPLPVSGIGASLSSGLSSIESWFTGQTLWPGLPNAAVLAGGFAVFAFGMSALRDGKKKRRK
jgi:hypothetical protein